MFSTEMVVLITIEAGQRLLSNHWMVNGPKSGAALGVGGGVSPWLR